MNTRSTSLRAGSGHEGDKGDEKTCWRSFPVLRKRYSLLCHPEPLFGEGSPAVSRTSLLRVRLFHENSPKSPTSSIYAAISLEMCVAFGFRPTSFQQNQKQLLSRMNADSKGSTRIFSESPCGILSHSNRQELPGMVGAIRDRIGKILLTGTSCSTVPHHEILLGGRSL